MAPAVVALVLAGATGFALAQQAAPQPKAAKKSELKGDDIPATRLGSYLAGRFAQIHGSGQPAIDFYRAVLKDEPGNVDVARRLLALLIAEGKMDDALGVAKSLNGKSGDAEDDDGNLAQFMLAMNDMKAGRFAEADKTLAAFPKTGLATLTGPLLRAWAQAGEKKFDDALKTLSSDDQNQGFAILFGAHAAAVNELAGRADAAEKGYLSSMEGRQSANLRLVQLLGNFYERTSKPDQAQKLYDDYMADHPDSTMLTAAMQRVEKKRTPKPEIGSAGDGAAEALFSLAGSVQQQSSLQSIIFARLAIYLKPDFYIAKLLIAETLEGDRRFDDAIAIYRNVANDSNYAWAAQLRIADDLDQLDRTDAAIAEIKQMSDKETKRSDALIRMGDILRHHNRYPEAAKAYADAKTRIGTLKKENWSLLYASGIANERIKNWDQAEADFLKALEFEPEQPYVLNYLGYSWIEMGKNVDKAKEMIELAVKKRPRDGYIVDSLGWVMYRMGDLPNAVRTMERAVTLRPEDPTINDHLGDVYWKVNRRDEAVFQWKRALSLDPEEEDVPKIQKKIKEGLNS